ncbi:MAG: two pore domain potassium channel family protein, partial [Syntrophorhabdus sp.]
QFLSLWERWSSELLESHLSYPVLAYFRSQHDNESWLGALTVILDTSSLLITYFSGECRKQAELTFAMARHAVVDLCIVFNTPPLETAENRLPADVHGFLLSTLQEYGFAVSHYAGDKDRLSNLRSMYEPYILAMADHLCIPVPPWAPTGNEIDNWRLSAWGEDRTEIGENVSGDKDHRKHF